MKRIFLVLFFLGCLFITGCTSNEKTSFVKEKECADYRNQYISYLGKKYNFIDEQPHSFGDMYYNYSEYYENFDGITYDVLEDISIFYSESEDSCIAGYVLREFYPTAGGHNDALMWYIVDAFRDKVLWEKTYDYDSEGYDDYHKLLESFK